MKHRHLQTENWTRAAIDSALEYGDLPDWRELFAAAKADPRIAEEILFVAEAREADGASTLARKLVAEFFPQLTAPLRGKHR